MMSELRDESEDVRGRMPELFLIDAIGPFFRGYEKRRVNWSKIPFTHLATEGEARERQWAQIREDLGHFAAEVSELGYNAVTLDDVAHLVAHHTYEAEVRERIEVFREEFAKLFELLGGHGLRVYLTSDILPCTAALEASVGHDKRRLEEVFCGMIEQVLDDFPALSGVIFRLGESDGVDVRDPIRTRLHLTTASETNALLRRLLPVFEARERQMILRTWTVGAHRIGDLIWHRRTFADAFEGLESRYFVISMKYGESDFFRYLPLNRAFFRSGHQKLIEFQARREYEGAGEFPAPIGRDLEGYARELAECENLIGVSVWCQTGGWHRFRRLAFLPDAGEDRWIRLNCQMIVGVFRDGLSSREVLRGHYGDERGEKIGALLDDAETVIRDLMYIEDFARQKLFFRRVRIPPLLHIYWDSLFINHAVRKVLRHFVEDPERSLRAGEAAYRLFPKMIEIAREAGLPAEDIEHWRDFCFLVRLARRYYFLPYDDELVAQIREAKSVYKKRWPREQRARYRIKTNFEPFRVKRRTLGWLADVLLRRQRGYRVFDHVFTLNLLGMVFRVFRPRKKQSIPKFLRKSAMGIETLFR